MNDVEQDKVVDELYESAKKYYLGNGVEQNYERAFSIVKHLYETYNYEKALVMLIEMYNFGRGTEKNYKKVLELGEKYLCNKKDKYISFYLGQIYFYGDDVEKNYEKSIHYFEESLDIGTNSPYLYLSVMYRYGGYGIRKDEIKYNKYIYNIKKDYYTAIIYELLSLNTDNNLEKLYKENIKNCFELGKTYNDTTFEMFPKEHPAYKYYQKIKYLDKNLFNNFLTIEKENVYQFFEKNTYNVISLINSENDVDKLVKKMIDMKGI